jgi:hypothetical protein
MAKIGPIIADRVASKPAAKPAATPAPKPAAAKPASTPAKSADQMEREAKAAAAAKAATIASEAKRDQVRADAHKAEKDREAAEKAAVIAQEAKRDAILAKRLADEKAARDAEARSNQPRRPENWNEIIHEDRKDRGVGQPQTSSSKPQTPKTETPKQQVNNTQPETGSGSGGSGGSTRPVEPTPPQPVPLISKERQPVKYATPEDVLIDSNELPIDLILKLTLEKIGGLELINLVRHDTVNGQSIIYRPVKNISQLAIDYNPQNMIKMPDSADSYFKNFAIKLENHVQQTTNELPPLVAYIDTATKNVIIDVVNLKSDYEIEVQMVSSGKVFDDTMYIEES